MEFRLLKKSLKGLILKYISYAQIGEKVKLMFASRRQRLFKRWFDYVHNCIPKLKRADIQYKQIKFFAFASYVKKMKPIRDQRKKFK
jgi:hypothetical protein